MVLPVRIELTTSALPSLSGMYPILSETAKRAIFELISGIAKRAAIDVPEGTLYPLLLRLAKDGLISSRLAGGDGGAPRKYYALTVRGKALLAGMIPSWSKLAASVDRLLPGVSA